MIIELLLSTLYSVFNLLTTPINIPNLPTQIEEYFSYIIQYFGIGAGIISIYTPYTYLIVLFGIILAIDIGIKVYQFVMWVLKKIPFLGIQ